MIENFNNQPISDQEGDQIEQDPIQTPEVETAAENTNAALQTEAVPGVTIEQAVKSSGNLLQKMVKNGEKILRSHVALVTAFAALAGGCAVRMDKDGHMDISSSIVIQDSPTAGEMYHGLKQQLRDTLHNMNENARAANGPVYRTRTYSGGGGIAVEGGASIGMGEDASHRGNRKDTFHP